LSRLLLGIVAALEAVAIAALLVLRPPSPEAGVEGVAAGVRESARADARDAAPSPLPPARERPDDGSGDDRAATLPATATGSPQSLVAPALAGGEVGIVLCGMVAAADGEPIDDALVVLEFSDRDSDVGPVRGAWSAAGFAPGPVHVSCMAVGFLSQSLELELDASRPVERHDFRLELAPSIPVAFRTPDGQPLLPQLEAAMIPGKLRAIATLEAPGAELILDATPQLGAWLQFGSAARQEGLDGELAGQGWTGLIKPNRPAPFFVSAVWGRQVLASERVTSANAQVTFSFALDTFFAALGSVRARVVDRADRRPVAGVLAQLDSTLLDLGDDGTLLFERVAPGKHTLKLFPPGAWQHIAGDSTMMSAPGTGDYERLELAVECQAGQQLDLGDLAVQSTVTVRGRVTNAAGVPIVTTVTVRCADADAPAGDVVLHPAVDEHGGFVVHLVPGHWSFSAGPDSTAVVRVVDVTGDIDDLQIIGVGAPVGQ